MLSVDTSNLRHLPRRSSNNCDLEFANTDRLKEDYSIDNNIDFYTLHTPEIQINELFDKKNYKIIFLNI